MMLWLLSLFIVQSGSGAEWVGRPPTHIQRIVSLAPSTTELLFALGVGNRVVGVTRFDDYPPQIAGLPRVGGFVDPDPEAVLALKPDLAVAIPTSSGRKRVDLLARLGVPVLVVSATRLGDLWHAIDTLGSTLHVENAAAALTKRLQEGLQKIARQYRDKKHKRVLMIVGRKPLVAAGGGTYLDDLLAAAGARNVVTSGGAFPILDMEAIAALDPDVIVDMAMSHENDGVAFWENHTLLRAVRNKRVRFIADESVLRLGPRLLDSARLMVEAVQF